jgi:hypothetical protein
MAIALRRRATPPSAQRTSEGRKLKRCKQQAVIGEEAMQPNHDGTNRASFRAGVRKAG